MYSSSARLVVMRVASPEEAEIVYDGPGEDAWTRAGRIGKNGQRVISLAKLRALAGERERQVPLCAQPHGAAQAHDPTSGRATPPPAGPSGRRGHRGLLA